MIQDSDTFDAKTEHEALQNLLKFDIILTAEMAAILPAWATWNEEDAY